MTLKELGLTQATIEKLHKANIYTVEQLSRKHEEEIISIKGIGRRALDSIVYRLSIQGLYICDCDKVCKHCACFHEMYVAYNVGNVLHPDLHWLIWNWCTAKEIRVRENQKGCEFFVSMGERPIKIDQ